MNPQQKSNNFSANGSQITSMCQQKSNNFSRLYPGGAGGEGKLQVILNIIHINFNASTEVKHLQRTVVELVEKGNCR